AVVPEERPRSVADVGRELLDRTRAARAVHLRIEEVEEVLEDDDRERGVRAPEPLEPAADRLRPRRRRVDRRVRVDDEPAAAAAPSAAAASAGVRAAAARARERVEREEHDRRGDRQRDEEPAAIELHETSSGSSFTSSAARGIVFANAGPSASSAAANGSMS